MKTIKSWQTQVREYFLQKMINKIDLRRTTVTYESAQTIGILFDATELNHRETVAQFSKELKARNKKVKLIGFFDNKQEVSNFPFKAFNKNDIDWLMRPKGQIVENFMNNTFDLLIGIYEGNNLPLEYIAALSKAHLRVGPYTDNTYCYDLMIDTDKRNLKNYIKQVEFYLNKMNSSKHETATI
jgi:hypothetical protein